MPPNPEAAPGKSATSRSRLRFNLQGLTPKHFLIQLPASITFGLSVSVSLSFLYWQYRWQCVNQQITWTELVQHGLSASLLLPCPRSPTSDCHLSCIASLMDVHGAKAIPSSFLLLAGVATQVGSQDCNHISGLTRQVTGGATGGVRGRVSSQVKIEVTSGVTGGVTWRVRSGVTSVEWQVESQVGSQCGVTRGVISVG